MRACQSVINSHRNHFYSWLLLVVSRCMPRTKAARVLSCGMVDDAGRTGGSRVAAGIGGVARAAHSRGLGAPHYRFVAPTAGGKVGTCLKCESLHSNHTPYRVYVSSLLLALIRLLLHGACAPLSSPNVQTTGRRWCLAQKRQVRPPRLLTLRCTRHGVDGVAARSAFGIRSHAAVIFEAQVAMLPRRPHRRHSG